MWPLSEPAVLKKKFDEIFASTKYTKVLDNIKAIRKEQTAELKVENVKLDHLKSDKEKSVKVETNLKLLEKQRNKANARIETLDREDINETQAKIQESSRLQSKLYSISNEIEHNKRQQVTLEKNIADISVNLQIYTEADDELKIILDRYLASLNSKKNENDDLERKRDLLNLDCSNLEKEHSHKLTEAGQLQAESDVFYFNPVKRSKTQGSRKIGFGFS